VNASLVLLWLAGAALVAFGTSAVIALSMRVARQKIDGLDAGAQARLLWVVALLPALVSAATMTAALAPAFGWIADHCFETVDLHSHPHICAEHHEAALPGLGILAVAALLVLRVAWVLGRQSHALLAAWRVKRELQSVARRARAYFVLPLPEPQAFVIGLFRPIVFVTAGLLSPEHRAHLRPVLAHEHGHLRRRDPLRRFIAGIALAFHLPGIARRVERSLSAAQEMAADAEAAARVGSPERVARALVQLARAQLRVPETSFAFGTTNVEARVRRLLDHDCGTCEPKARTLVIGSFLLFACLALAAGPVHHGVEMLLGLFGA
jgi:Zn-dependent protease with chaperone function